MMTTEQQGTAPDPAVAEIDTLAEFDPDDAAPTQIDIFDVEARAELERLHNLLELVAPAPVGIGRYRLERVLGRGGMGVVHLAWDPELDRHVALKLVHSGPFVDEGRLEARLRREARVLAQLNHPNVVRVYDVDLHEGQLYVTMEYVDGPTLRAWRSAATRSSDEIVTTYVQAGRGLAAVHRAGIVHRDFKPDNVLIDREGRVVVGDFGLADDRDLAPPTGASDEARGPIDLTRTGALLGTLRYMAFERLVGEPASPASDQFEFCASLWEALTGSRPFAGDTREELIQGMKSPPRGGEQLDRRVRRALERGLALEPGRRFAELDELLGELDPPAPSWRAITMIGLAVIVGLVIGNALFDPTPSPVPPPPCALNERFIALEERPLALPAGTSESARAAVAAELDRAEQRLRGEIAGVCATPAGDDDPAVERWVVLLEHIVDHASRVEVTRTLDNLDAFAFERERMPPLLLEPELVRRLDEVRDALLAGELDQAESSIADAERFAVTRADQAELTLRRAQLAQRRGQPHGALELLGVALRHADVARRDQDRLILHLLSADIALRSARDDERAAFHHQSAADLFERLELPADSSLRIAHRQHDALVAGIAEGGFTRALTIQDEVVQRRETEGNPRLIVDALLERGALRQRRLVSAEKQPNDSELALADHRRVLADLDRLDAGPRDPQRIRAHYNIALLLWMKGDAAELPELRSHLDVVLAAGRSSLLLPALHVASAVAIEQWQADPIPNHRDAMTAHAAQLRTVVAEPDLAPIDRIDGWTYLALLLAHLDDLSALEAANSEVLTLVAEAREQGVLTPFAADLHLAGHALQVCAALEESRPELARAYLVRSRGSLEPLVREQPDHPEVTALVDGIALASPLLALEP